MALRVLGRVEEQAQHRRWQASAANLSRFVQRAERCRPRTCDNRTVDGLESDPHEILRQTGYVLAGFRLQRRALRGVQGLAAGIRQQTVQAPGEVQEMKANRGRAARLRPSLSAGRVAAAGDLLADLHAANERRAEAPE